MNRTLKSALTEQRHTVGTWLSIGHPSLAEVTARLDYEFILIDTEHTPIGLETLENIVRAIDAADGDTGVVVRVPWNDRVHLKRVLDIGVDGVMVPMIESVEDAEELVESVRYPPEGRRGIAGGRAAGYGLDLTDYFENADQSILTIAQIETPNGLDDVEEIASVDGIDALFVGPSDLSGSLGVFADWDDQEYISAVERVVEVGRATGTATGSLAVRPDDIERRLTHGFDYLIVGKDTTVLVEAHEEAIDEYESTLDRFEQHYPLESE